MTEDELRAVKPFDTLPVVAEANADFLARSPHDPKFSGVIREASDKNELAGFLADSNLVPQGAYCDEFGQVQAIFWELR